MADAVQRWLILVHQLPARPSNLRVRVWRRLQQVGAVVLRNSLYVLPATDEAREDFNWVREEINASGGQVSVLEAAAVDGYTDGELVQQFRKLRTAEYEALAAEIRAAVAKAGARKSATRGPAARRRSGTTPADRERLLRGMRERLTAIQTRDYFGAAGRALVEQALKDLEQAERPRADVPEPAARLRASDYRRRTWVTRARPGIDRLASAWFIRRFISPDAKFAFVSANGTSTSLRAGASVDGRVPFDLPDVQFGHHGPHCTFETLMHRFAISDAGLTALSRVVHDLDLKETRYGMPECAAVGRLVDGLRASYSDDAELLEHGMVVMEALYRSFAADGRAARNRGRKKREPR